MKSDVINLNVNINNDPARAALNDLRKTASNLRDEMKGIKKNSDEYIDKMEQLDGITEKMNALKKEIGVSALSLKELNNEVSKLTKQRNSKEFGTEEWKKYNAELQVAVARQKEVKAGADALNQTRGFQSLQEEGLKAANAIEKGFTQTFSRILSASLAFMGMNAVFDFIKNSIEVFEKSEQSIKRETNALKNMGASAEDIKKLSNSINDLTTKYTYLNKVDLRESQQKLVTYGKLTADQIVKLQPIIADFAANAEISIGEATDTMIKGLEGNAKALKLYGINVKDAKTEGERFAMLTDVLAAKVKGSADVMQDSSEGKIETYKQQLIRLQTTIGQQLMPVYEEGISTANKFIKVLVGWDFSNIVRGIAALAAGWALYKLYLVGSNIVTAISSSLMVANMVATTGCTAATAYNTLAESTNGKTKSANVLVTYAMIAAQKAYTIATNIATAAVELWNLALATTPIGWFIAGVVALIAIIGGAVYELKQLVSANNKNSEATKQAAENQDLLNDAMLQGQHTVENQKDVIEKLTKSVNDHNTSLADRKKALDELIALDPNYLSGLTQTNIETDAGRKIIEQYVEALNKKAEAEELEKKISQLNNDELDTKAGKGIETSLTQKAGDFLKGGIQGYDENEAITVAQNQNDKLKEIASEREALTKKLDELGKTKVDFNQKSNLGSYKDDKDPNAKKEESEYEKMKKELLSFQEEVKKIKRDNEIDGESEDQKEIERIQKKYADLTEKAQQYLIKVHSLKGKAGKELEAKVNESLKVANGEEVTELDRAGQKKFGNDSDKEYEGQIKNTEEFYDKLKELQSKRLLDGFIDEKTHAANVAAIEDAAAKEQLKNADDYAATSKKAASDLTKLKADELKKQTADFIAELHRQEAEKKLLLQLDKEAEKADVKRKLLTNQPDSAAYKKAEQDQLQLDRKEAKEALDLKREEALKAVENDKDKTEKQKQIEEDYFSQLRLINAQYDDGVKKAKVKEVDDFKKSVDQKIQYAQAANTILSNMENAQVKKLEAIDAQRTRNMQKQLQNKMISQRQFDVEQQKMQQELDDKKRKLAYNQAVRDKAINLAVAIETAAFNVIKAGTNIPLAIEMGITGALEIAKIASTPLPPMGTGGWMKDGDKHSDPSGGIPAMIERDEAVMSAAAMTNNDKYTVTGTTAQITSALNSQKGGTNWAAGAKISMPNARAAQINPTMPRIMEQGGVVRPLIQGNNGGSMDGSGLDKIHGEILNLRGDFKNFNTNLNATVSIKEYRRKEAIYEAAKKASSLSPGG